MLPFLFSSTPSMKKKTWRVITIVGGGSASVCRTYKYFSNTTRRSPPPPPPSPINIKRSAHLTEYRSSSSFAQGDSVQVQVRCKCIYGGLHFLKINRVGIVYIVAGAVITQGRPRFQSSSFHHITHSYRSILLQHMHAGCSFMSRQE